MKNYFKVLAVALIAVFTMNYSLNAQSKSDAEVTFSVSIDCNNCVKKIEANIPFEKGVKDLKVDLEAKTVWIKYQSDKTTKENLAKAIEKLGYSAKEIKAEKKK